MTTSTAFFPCNSDSFIEYYVLVLQKNDSYNYSPHVLSFIFATIISILVFLISTLTGNFSQVDKLWSILPAIYAWVCYASAPINDARIIVMTFLVSAWSIRLTYNFYLRGGYTFPKFWQGDEDYRWEVLRSGGVGGGGGSNSLLKGTPLIYLANNKYMLHVFNLLFISFFQNYLLLYITSPSLVAWEMAMRCRHCNVDNPLNKLDYIATALFVISLIGETIADNQQRQFQKEKREWMLLRNSKTNTSKKKEEEDLTKFTIHQLREKVGSMSGISLSINEMKVWSKKELVDILITNSEHIRRGMKINANSMNTIGSYEDGFCEFSLFVFASFRFHGYSYMYRLQYLLCLSFILL
jgi:steroid 5-alpha reductase family enzyme